MSLKAEGARATFIFHEDYAHKIRSDSTFTFPFNQSLRPIISRVLPPYLPPYFYKMTSQDENDPNLEANMEGNTPKKESCGMGISLHICLHILPSSLIGPHNICHLFCHSLSHLPCLPSLPLASSNTPFSLSILHPPSLVWVKHHCHLPLGHGQLGSSLASINEGGEAKNSVDGAAISSINNITSSIQPVTSLLQVLANRSLFIDNAH